jgi:hypothetical protein
MKSHEFAAKLEEVAADLRSKPEFEASTYPFDLKGRYIFAYYYDKSNFLNAVKTMGSGEKDMSQRDEVLFYPTGLHIGFRIEKNLVCTKVQEAQYDCEPLLSQMDQQSFDSIT